MQYKTAAHKAVHEKARGLLKNLFGEINVKEADGTFMLQEGSTLVYISTFPIGEKKAGVEVFSYVVIDVPVTEALMRYLLTYNLKLILGGFGLSIGPDGKASVLLSHTILGDTMDKDELYASVSAVAGVANNVDDYIVATFGGKTAVGKLTETRTKERWE